MTKGIIYYTDNRLEEPIYTICQGFIAQAKLPITSASLKPIEFGDNAVVEGKWGYVTLIKQIISCLDRSKEDYVYFCEHDVLYHHTHFDFTPPEDDVFYYNNHVFRWLYGTDYTITYTDLISVSGICVNREFALGHYKERLAFILKNGWDKVPGKEPQWARRMGYEPGKTRHRGGYFDTKFALFRSKKPIIDIRHKGTLSRPKTTLREFKHEPKDWLEIPINWIDGWNLKELFNL